jgi:hypothetical protein
VPCAFLPLAAQTSAPSTPKPLDTPSAVHRLYVEDQEDTRTTKDEATNAEYLQRVKVRQQTLRTWLAAGQITSGDDFLEALSSSFSTATPQTIAYSRTYSPWKR